MLRNYNYVKNNHVHCSENGIIMFRKCDEIFQWLNLSNDQAI